MWHRILPVYLMKGISAETIPDPEFVELGNPPLLTGHMRDLTLEHTDVVPSGQWLQLQSLKSHELLAVRIDRVGRRALIAHGNALSPTYCHHLPAGPTEVGRPLVVSPDDRTLYLIETNQGEGGARMIRAYDLSEEGTVSNMRVFHDFSPGRSGDGMTIDSEGNVWVAAGLNRRRGTSETLDTRAGVYVFAPTGELLELIPIPEDTITNVAFGGDDLRTLYITAGKTLFQLRNDIPGTRR